MRLHFIACSLALVCGACSGANPNYTGSHDLSAPDGGGADFAAGDQSDLSGTDFSPADFSGTDFSGGDFATPVDCVIAGVHRAAGTIDPGDLCKSCQPAVSATDWSPLADGTTCASGKVCVSGTCAIACDVGGQWFVDGYLDPANDCKSCQVAVNASDWSALPNGTSCSSGAGQCRAGACLVGCTINGTNYPTGAVNPSNPCQRCEPSVNATDWTAIDGGSCGTGLVCNNGNCVAGCKISGFFYQPGAHRTQNLCGDTCIPTTSVSAWSTPVDGTGCRIPGGTLFTYSEGVCQSGTCRNDCYIAGAFVANGTIETGNQCMECITPTFMTGQPEPPPSTAWTALDGSACGTNMKCVMGTCE